MSPIITSQVILTFKDTNGRSQSFSQTAPTLLQAAYQNGTQFFGSSK